MISDDDVASFVAMTGAKADEAHGYLEMAAGDLHQAANLFFEMGGGGGGAPSPVIGPMPSGPMRPASAAVPGGDASVAAEVAAAAAAAGIDTDPLLPDSHMGDGGEVRAPIAAYQDQIIDPEQRDGECRSRYRRTLLR